MNIVLGITLVFLIFSIYIILSASIKSINIYKAIIDSYKRSSEITDSIIDSLEEDVKYYKNINNIYVNRLYKAEQACISFKRNTKKLKFLLSEAKKKDDETGTQYDGA